MAGESSATDIELEVPTADAAGTVADAPATQDAKPAAESSDAGEVANQPKSALEAVKIALAKSAEAGDSTAPVAKTESTAEAKPEDGDGKTEDADETKLPFHKHPAWQRMKTERDESRAERDGLKSQLAVAGEKATRFDTLQTMMTEASLDSQEVDNGFAIMAAMKSDPHKALELLRPYWDALCQATGNGELSADIQAEVDAGYVTPERAREIARLRAESDQSRARDARERKAETDRAANAGLVAANKAVDEWETAWRKSDPDYAKKHALVFSELTALASREGPPASADAAFKMAEKARKNVEASLGTIVPKKPAVAVIPSSAPVTTKRAPASALEAAQQALARGAAA